VLILGMLILANVAILLVDGATVRHHALCIRALSVGIVETEAKLPALWMLLRGVRNCMTSHVARHIRAFARAFGDARGRCSFSTFGTSLRGLRLLLLAPGPFAKGPLEVDIPRQPAHRARTWWLRLWFCHCPATPFKAFEGVEVRPDIGIA
jgi:hypothetical protein